MRLGRSVLFVTSVVLAVFVLFGGMAVRVGAGENSYREVVLFSEILGLVLDNYVDPVSADELLRHSYEGLLGGLDVEGAFLSQQEVDAWKRAAGPIGAGPGVSVLKAGASLQVVAVDPGSSADEHGVRVGDQIRRIAGRPVRDLSLSQAWQVLDGEPGTEIEVELLHPTEGFERKTVSLTRRPPLGSPHELTMQDGVAVLRVRDIARIDPKKLAADLDDVRRRSAGTLLLDLRNSTCTDTRRVASLAGLVGEGAVLQLRDAAGRLTESLSVERWPAVWDGPVAALVNGATAGAAEALAALIADDDDGRLLGESTYGLGSEPRLYELDNGAGLLVPSLVWETAKGLSWHQEGLEPDTVVRGEGRDLEAISGSQLDATIRELTRETGPTAAAGLPS